MTTYSVLVYFSNSYVLSKTWKSKSVNSRIKIILMYNEILDDIHNSYRYNRNKLDYKYDYKSLHNVCDKDDFEIQRIACCYRREGDWFEFQPNTYCLTCGRLLEDQESIDRHYGPICWAKKQNSITRNMGIRRRRVHSLLEYL